MKGKIEGKIASLLAEPLNFLSHMALLNAFQKKKL